MNVIDALNSRFTVRAYEPDPAHKLLEKKEVLGAKK
jgi:hypothetical protein